MEGLLLKLKVFCAYHMDSHAEISDPGESMLADAERIAESQDIPREQLMEVRR